MKLKEKLNLNVYEIELSDERNYVVFMIERGYSFEQVPDWIKLDGTSTVAINDSKDNHCGRIINKTRLEIPSDSELDKITREYISIRNKQLYSLRP